MDQHPATEPATDLLAYLGTDDEIAEVDALLALLADGVATSIRIAALEATLPPTPLH